MQNLTSVLSGGAFAPTAHYATWHAAVQPLAHELGRSRRRTSRGRWQRRWCAMYLCAMAAVCTLCSTLLQMRKTQEDKGPPTQHKLPHRTPCTTSVDRAAGMGHLSSPTGRLEPRRYTHDTCLSKSAVALVPSPHTEINLTGQELNSSSLNSLPWPSSTTKSPRPRPPLYMVNGAGAGRVVANAKPGWCRVSRSTMPTR